MAVSSAVEEGVKLAGSEIGGGVVASEETAAAPDASEETRLHIARLVADLAHERAPDDSGEIVFDAVLDGNRYTIVARPTPGAADEPQISAREREIARMVALGYTNKGIAAVLEISTWTVGTHLRRIYGKLGVHSRGAMVARLLECGLLPAAGASPSWQRLWRTP